MVQTPDTHLKCGVWMQWGEKLRTYTKKGARKAIEYENRLCYNLLLHSSETWSIVAPFPTNPSKSKLALLISSSCRAMFVIARWVSEENIATVGKVVHENNQVSFKDIEVALRITSSTVKKILHEHLRVRKLSFWWVPHTLTDGKSAYVLNGAK